MNVDNDDEEERPSRRSVSAVSPMGKGSCPGQRQASEICNNQHTDTQRTNRWVSGARLPDDFRKWSNEDARPLPARVNFPRTRWWLAGFRCGDVTFERARVLESQTWFRADNAPWVSHHGTRVLQGPEGGQRVRSAFHGCLLPGGTSCSSFVSF